MKQWKCNYYYKKTIIIITIIFSIFMVGCGQQAGNSLDGTWEISSETLQEINTDNSEYQLISQSVVFSGESMTVAHTVDYKDDTVSMSDEELLGLYDEREDGREVEFIKRGDNNVIISWTAAANFSLTEDETGIVLDGEEYVAPYSRTGKNSMLLDELKYVRKN